MLLPDEGVLWQWYSDLNATQMEEARREDKPALLNLCVGVDTYYNERSYDGRRNESGREDDNGRGWCVHLSVNGGDGGGRGW